MKSSCSEIEPLLLDRAGGSLGAAEAGRLEAHLAGCQACRAEAASLESAVAAARLAPPSEAERRALERAQAATLRHWRGAEGSRRNRTLVQGFSAGFAVAAAAAVLAVAPGSFGLKHTEAGAVASAVQEAAADPGTSDESWEPDLDTAWEVAALATDEAPAGGQLDSTWVDSTDLIDE